MASNALGSRWLTRRAEIAADGREYLVIIDSRTAEADMRTVAATLAAGGLKLRDIAAALRVDVEQVRVWPSPLKRVPQTRRT